MEMDLDWAVDTAAGAPDLSRMHADAEGALGSRGIRCPALGSEGTILLNLVDGVAVDVVAVLLEALDSLAAEAGDELRGGRNPDTRGLRSRARLYPPALLVENVPALLVEEGHEIRVLVVGETAAVEDVLCRILHLEIGGEGLRPELLLLIRPVLLDLLDLGDGDHLVDDRLVEPVRGLHFRGPAGRSRVEDVLILTPLPHVLYRQRDYGLSDRDGHFFLRIREGKGSEATLTYPRTVTDSTQNLGRSHWLLRARTLCGRVHLGVLGYLLSYACILQGGSGSKHPSTFYLSPKSQKEPKEPKEPKRVWLVQPLFPG